MCRESESIGAHRISHIKSDVVNRIFLLPKVIRYSRLYFNLLLSFLYYLFVLHICCILFLFTPIYIHCMTLWSDLCFTYIYICPLWSDLCFTYTSFFVDSMVPKTPVTIKLFIAFISSISRI